MVAAVPTRIATALERKAYYFRSADGQPGRRNPHRRPLRRCPQRQRRLPSQRDPGRFAVRLHLHSPDGRQVLRSVRVLSSTSGTRWSSGLECRASSPIWPGARSKPESEARRRSTPLNPASWPPANGPDAERFKNEYLEATFSDTISIYLLSLYLDFDYWDLRERDYPLLAPSALAERLRKVAELFPPNSWVRIRHPLQAPGMKLMATGTAQRPPRWYGIPFRVLLATFIGTLICFAVSLLVAIFGTVIVSALRGIAS